MNLKWWTIIFLNSCCLAMLLCAIPSQAQQATDQAGIIVKRCDNFDVTGSGDNKTWNSTSWVKLNKLDGGGIDYESKFKILYSSTGLYVLFSGNDTKISTTYDKDFDNLFRGDVFEVFFHPDTTLPLYFEYEINQLNKELVLIIPNLNGGISGWLPWHYENDRQTKKMVSVHGGKATPNGAITSWTAELFFPYKLLSPLNNVPPKSGTTWNANFYRLDYDTGGAIKWAWGPVDKSFHEYKRFLPIRFE